MKRMMLLAVFLAFLASSSGEAQVADSLREQIRIHEIVLEGQLEDVAEARQQLRELWSQLELQSGNLMRAQREGETVDSLRLRDEDLRRIESEFLGAIFNFQQERRVALEHRTMLAALATEVERLSVEVGEAEAPLTGTWRLVVEPGQDGTAYFQQQGTLVTGTYALTGGFLGFLPRHAGGRQGAARTDRLADRICCDLLRPVGRTGTEPETSGKLGGHPTGQRSRIGRQLDRHQGSGQRIAFVRVMVPVRDRAEPAITA